MNYIGKFFTNFKDFYREINSATLTGAIDVVIVKQADNTYLCSPFHVRFGKMGVLRSKEKIVDIEINGEPSEIFMKLGDNGEAFFVEECNEFNEGSNSTTRIMCKQKVFEEMGLQEELYEDNNNLTEYNLYENDFSSNDQINSLDENINNNLCDKLEELKFSSSNLSLTRTKSIPISTLNSEIHPYSDGEMTPFNNNSPKNDFDRPFSPKSDTEYEITKNDCKKAELEEEVSWQWGELPQVSRKVSVASKTSDSGLIDYEIKNNLSNANSMNAFTIKEEIRDHDYYQTKKANFTSNNYNFNKDQSKNNNSKLNNLYKKEGIYLDEINPDNLDPEVADLYFPKLRSTLPLKKVSDDETESGKGLSLPSNSPQRDNQLFQSSGSDNEQEDSKDSVRIRINKSNNYKPIANNLLEKNNNCIKPNLDYSLISQKYSDLAISLCEDYLTSDEISEEKFLKNQIHFNTFSENPMNILQNPNLVVRLNGKYYNYQLATPILMSFLFYQKELPDNFFHKLEEQQKLSNKKKKESNRSSWWSWRRSNAEKSPSNDLMKNIEKSKNSNNAKALFDSKKNDGCETDLDENYDDDHLSLKSSKKYRKLNFKKVLRLGSLEIENLKLKEGANEVVFSVTTAYQGTTRCMCQVYLWNYDDKIIVSDIDGTITKSDVLGHILPILGKDWAQSGVANLFTKIKRNGYKLLYLSARAIGQAEITREYLKSVRQGELCLPDGPLLLSPTSLISAFHREVIEKKPEEFKISCLKDIGALFPSNPFYAGFGNKINDTWAYRAVGIPLSRIFTINHKGELKLELIQTFQSSYTKLTSVVDQMFPPLEDKLQIDCLVEFSSFNYWRDVLPEIDET